MKKATGGNGDMREHYNFRGCVRGKYVARYAEGPDVVVLEADLDVTEMFPDLESVTRRGGRRDVGLANIPACRRSGLDVACSSAIH